MANEDGARKVGDWSGARRLTREMKGVISDSNTRTLMQIGLITERKVIKFIQSQPGIWPALNEKYKARKIAMGESNLMLRRSGQYINNISSWVDAPVPQVFIGVKKTVTDDEGNELANIGAIMEFGSKKAGIPARPHFNPVHRVMRIKIQKDNMFGQEAMKQLKRKYRLT